MSTPYDSSAPPPDEIRELIPWWKFSTPKFVFFGMCVALFLIVMSGRDPEPNARGAAYEAAGEVIGTARQITESLGW